MNTDQLDLRMLGLVLLDCASAKCVRAPSDAPILLCGYIIVRQEAIRTILEKELPK